jgi:hypothetical protein
MSTSGRKRYFDHRALRRLNCRATTEDVSVGKTGTEGKRILLYRFPALAGANLLQWRRPLATNKFVVVDVDVPLTGPCALLVAARVGRRLTFVGRLQWGIGRRVVAELRERCGVRATPACAGVDRVRGVVWVEPSSSVVIQYNG